MKFLLVTGMIFLIGSAIPEGARADEVTGTPGDVSQVPAQTSKAPKRKKRSKGTVTREKETEGTEAPNRFEADTVIKSQYKLDGKPLEVDPD